MNDNTMLRIIIESNLHIRIMEHFLLIGNQPSLKLDKIQEDNIILSFANQLYEDIVPVLVEEYNKYCEEGIIYGNTFQKRVDSFTTMIKDKLFIENLFRKYPLLENILKINFHDFTKLIYEIYKNYETDKLLIREKFNKDFGKIVNININLGDKHNGKTVAKVEFENGNLMYKPRRLLSSNLYDELLRFIENKGVIDFKHYQSIVMQDYTWQEFVLYDADLTFAEAQRYYYRAGVLLSLFFILKSTDMHHENIIVSGEYPMIIDTETILSAAIKDNMEITKGRSIEQSVLSTAMLPINDSVYDINVSGLFFKEEFSKTIYYYSLIENKEKDFYYEKKAASTSLQKNIVFVNGKIVGSEEVGEKLLEGFEAGAKCLLRNLEEFKKILGSSKYAQLEVRALLRGTQVYYTFIRECKKIETLKNKQKFDKILRILLKGFQPAEFGYLRVEEEIENLKKLDIPLFYTKLNDVNLYSRNKVICNEYFKNSPLQNVLNGLSVFNEEMIKYQKHLIELSLFTFSCKESDINTESLLIDKSIENKELQYILGKYAYEMLSYEVPMTDDSSLFYMAALNQECLRIDAVNAGIYMGGGIIHFLYSYADVFKDETIKKYSKRLLKGIYNRYLIEKEKMDIKPFGIYEGYGGILYLSYNYSRLNEDLEIDTIFQTMLIDVLDYYSTKSFDRKIDTDYINGIGSTILLLGKIYFEKTVDRSIEQKLENLFEKYYEFLKISSIEDSIGIAHGLSGVSVVLSYIYRIFREEECLKLIETLITKEDQIIEKYLKTNTISYTWCRGMAGVLVSRCVIKENLEYISGNTYLKNYLQKKKNKYSTKNIIESMMEVKNACLCHGIAGNIDAINYFNKVTGNSYKTDYFIDNIDSYNWFTNSKYQFESFMLGKAGLMYSLLYQLEGNNVLSISALEIVK